MKYSNMSLQISLQMDALITTKEREREKKDLNHVKVIER